MYTNELLELKNDVDITSLESRDAKVCYSGEVQQREKLLAERVQQQPNKSNGEGYVLGGL